MATTKIFVNDRLFTVSISECANASGYRCQFSEKYTLFGRECGFKPHNKNIDRVRDEDDIYGWFRNMVEKNTPEDTSADELLDSVVEQLEDEFDAVSRRNSEKLEDQ